MYDVINVVFDPLLVTDSFLTSKKSSGNVISLVDDVNPLTRNPLTLNPLILNPLTRNPLARSPSILNPQHRQWVSGMKRLTRSVLQKSNS